ncbi:MAG: PAS domain S-box protein, partial [Cyclobacteriaceae bacterium]|nr:PAS domain S-box protein [Cyclobacteriaceae bacterium]
MVGMVGMANRKNGYNEELVDFIRPLINSCSSLIHGVIVKEKNKILENDYINQFESIKASLLELEVDFEGKILHLNHNFTDLINPMETNHNLHLKDIFINGNAIQGKNKNTLGQILFNVSKGENYLGEFLCTKEKWVRGTFIPIKNELGFYYKASFLGRDFTAEKLAITEKDEAVQKLNQILEQAVNAVIAIDKNKAITFYNKAAVKLFGWSKDDVMGKNVKIIVPEEYKERHDDYVDENINTGINRVVGIGRDVEMVKKDGSRFWGHLSLSKVIVGKEVSYTAFINDISVRKQHEEEKTKYIETIEKQNQELEQFAFIASHDLQEPLRTITSFLSIIKEEYGSDFDEDLTTYLGFINKSALRMSTLIRDLFDLSQIGKKKEFKKINLNSILKDIKKDLAQEIKEAGVEIKSQSLPKVMGIEKDIRLLIKNLVSNSVKYSGKKEKAEIKISYEEEDTHWKFKIEDNGIGINPRFFEKIFVIFQRLHTKDEYPGTGIGLAQCKKVVEDHGGKIWVDSIVGIGSSFFFTLKK